MEIYTKNYLAELLLKDNVGRKRLISELNNYQKDTSYIEELEEQEVSVIAFDEDEYPQDLKQISDFPILLFVKGDKGLLKVKSFTIVGTRKMTKYGKLIVEEFLKSLNNICIVSGLANGVDAEVHRNCLKNNISTIAVVAGGLYEGFPKSNSVLFEEICKKGVVISEFPPGRKLLKGMFPMRNRILAGMSQGVLVVESGEKGGSMITANLALEYGKEVFSIPGNIFSESSKGCNLLVSEGANIVRNKEEFVNMLNNCTHGIE